MKLPGNPKRTVTGMHALEYSKIEKYSISVVMTKEACEKKSEYSCPSTSGKEEYISISVEYIISV